LFSSYFNSKTTRGLTVLFLSTLMAGLGWSMILPIIPQFQSEFNVSAGWAVQVVTGFGLGRFFATPVAGYIVDRFGSRLALIGGPALATIGALGSAATPWFAVVIGAAFLVGAGESLWAFGREIAGIDLVRPDQRGRVLSGFHGVHAAGLAIGPLTGGLIADALGLRVVFIAFAVESTAAIMIGMLVANSRRHPPVPAPADAVAAVAPERRGVPPLSWWRSLKGLFLQIKPEFRVTYATLVFATFAGFLFRQGYQSLLPVFADEELGLSAFQIGILFSFAGILVLALTLPAGFIIDKVGRKWATVPSTALPGFAFLLVPFADTFWILAALVAIMGVANGLSLGSLATSTYDVVPAAARGRLQAMRRTIADVGAIGAPLLGGVLIDVYGPSVPFVVFAPVLLVAGAALAFFGKETLVKEPKETPAKT
jgi:MFS family permease